MSNQESDSDRIQRQANELSNHEYLQQKQHSSGCFPAGTKIETMMGSIPIENLSKGDRVVGVATTAENKSPRRILKVVKHAETAIWKITIDEDRYIHTTSIHSFYSNRKWRMAKSLKKGDSILFLSDKGIFKEETIVGSELDPQTLPVFNLIIENDFTFIANGAVVHSFSHFRKMRTIWWSIYSFFADVKLRTQSAELSRAQQKRLA